MVSPIWLGQICSSHSRKMQPFLQNIVQISVALFSLKTIHIFQTFMKLDQRVLVKLDIKYLVCHSEGTYGRAKTLSVTRRSPSLSHSKRVEMTLLANL